MSSPRSNLNQQPHQLQHQHQQQQLHKQNQNQNTFTGLNSNLANLATGAAVGASTVDSGLANGNGNGNGNGSLIPSPASVGLNGNHVDQNGINGNQPSLHSNLNGSTVEAQQANSSSSSSSINLKSHSNPSDPTSIQTSLTNGDPSSSPIPSSNNGKARQLDTYLDFDEMMAQAEQVPLDLLEAEIAPVDSEIVPLNAIVLRMANYGYDTLQNLTET